MTENSFRWAVIENITMLVVVAACVSSVAYFAESPAGLWSMVILLGLNNFKTSAPKHPEAPMDKEAG